MINWVMTGLNSIKFIDLDLLEIVTQSRQYCSTRTHLTKGQKKYLGYNPVTQRKHDYILILFIPIEYVSVSVCLIFFHYFYI